MPASDLMPSYMTEPERIRKSTYSIDLEPADPEAQPAVPPAKKTGGKPGIFQQIAFTATELPRGSSGLGISDLALQATFAFPAPTPDSPLVLTPAFEAQFLDGPTTPDLPARLYDASIQFRYLRKLCPNWGMDIAITPGWHGDFEPNDGQTFRLPARAILAYDWSPNLQLIGGLAYLDRDDVDFLPVAGVIWTPNEDTRLELLIPRPRIARRICCDCYAEYWGYIVGEFGGGSYGIRRADGSADVATLSDLRLIVGLERKVAGGINARFETGWVFSRQVDYQSGTPDFMPGDTFMVRAGAWY